MFECFDSRYDLRGRLITQTALHIGAGGSLAVVGSDNPVVRDVNGLPYIPGSSFKGSLRSLMEAIARALSPGDKQEPWACDPLNDPCVSPTDVEGLSDDKISQLVKRGTHEGGQACTICRLFGSPWLASKVKVADLYLTEGVHWKGRVEVRDGVAIDRDTETVSGGRKYDFEVVPRETAFNLHLRVDNARDEELGLLFLGLREFTNGGAWVGGNTSRGLGLVRIAWDEFETIVGRTGLLAYLQNGAGAQHRGDEITAFISNKIQAFFATLREGGKAHVEETAQPGDD
ncbi:MAG: CRISPR-associated RAMP protein Csx7 [Abditibacteriales bacterium]|nr:CRISPR-associated RAMP protein Csx7 [Abditibacteriales bacterium]MDW8365287.1 CRISPR-associated RAMP protein Csx7 [Abditibacteriales bacterium]